MSIQIITVTLKYSKIYNLVKGKTLVYQDSMGAFHYAKDSGNFGWNSNGKVRSVRFLLTGIFGITSGGGPHISVGILPTEICRSIFDKAILCPN